MLRLNWCADHVSIPTRPIPLESESAAHIASQRTQTDLDIRWTAARTNGFRPVTEQFSSPKEK